MINYLIGINKINLNTDLLKAILHIINYTISSPVNYEIFIMIFKKEI